MRVIHLSRVMRWSLCLWAVAVCSVAAYAQPAGSQPERRAPGPGATPGKIYAWSAEPKGVGGVTNFTWRLPSDYQPRKAYDMIVVLHPAGKDRTWAWEWLDEAMIKSISSAGVGGAVGRGGGEGAMGDRGLIILCPDGPVAEAGKPGHGYTADKDAVMRCRDFLLTATQEFPADRVYLLGFAEGGAFAIQVLGEFGALAEGVIAVDAKVWPTGPYKTRVPMVFVDGLTDLEQGPGFVDGPTVLREAGNEWWVWSGHAREAHASAKVGVDPQLIDPGLGPVVGTWLRWCAGMRAAEAAEVLDAAQAMVAAGQYGAASRLTERVTGTKRGKVRRASEQEIQRGKAIQGTCDEAAVSHVAALEQEIKGRSDVVLGAGSEGGAWLGHLLLAREAYRGTAPMEEYSKRLWLDEALAEHAQAARELWSTWNWKWEGGERTKFETAVGLMPRCYLSLQMPAGFVSQMRAWHERRAELGIAEEALEGYERVEQWERGIARGRARFEAIEAGRKKGAKPGEKPAEKTEGKPGEAGGSGPKKK